MPLNDQSVIGLANRFTVKVTPGDHDLGSWTKAEGLDVTWDVADYRAGDGGNQRWFFPGNTKYSHVRLSRAAAQGDSEKVKDWLSKTSFHNQSGQEVQITLHDSSTKKVLDWHLKNAMPAKWSIANFEAGGSNVAIETLELVHEGFLDDDVSYGG
jgi:phage tail-like protein